MKIIVTGGGTGGHIYPALSIADKFKERYDDAQILYVGVNGGLESKIVPKYGYDFVGLEVKGFQRKLSIENLKRIFLAMNAVKNAKKIIKEFNPDIVIGTGGYVCGPVVMAATKLNTVTAIHEQNAFPGITNKILASKTDRVFLGFEAASDRLKAKNTPISVGNPVRKNIRFAKSKEEARAEIGVSEADKFILVTGGSGGFGVINEAFVKLIPLMVENNIGFVFATGKNHYEKVMNQLEGVKLNSNCKIVEYIEDMPTYLAAADICVVSAGATTIAEINAIGKASIIIPKAYTAENHQEYNAKYIASKNAGRYILEKDLNEETLRNSVIEILDNNDLRLEMESNSKELGKLDPSEIIVSELEKLVTNKKVGDF